jgi:hypothetical protein
MRKVTEKQHSTDEPNTQNPQPIILPFAIVKMNNSPQDIKAAVVINRPYFEKDLCPMCDLGQPLKGVRQESWKEDFRNVDAAQLTPLDFWEMVQDCKALRRDEAYLGSASLVHRVETSKLVERYNHWLSNLIRFRCNAAWGSNKPYTIVTVSRAMVYPHF